MEVLPNDMKNKILKFNQNLEILSNNVMFPPEIIAHIKPYIYDLRFNMRYCYNNYYYSSLNLISRTIPNIRISFYISVILGGKIKYYIIDIIWLVYPPNIIKIDNIKKYLELMRKEFITKQDCSQLFIDLGDHYKNTDILSPLCKDFYINKYFFPKEKYVKMLDELITKHEEKLNK